MLDVGFWELLLVSVIALIFIGPEKLPGTIRTIALMVGRFRRSLTNLRNEFESEIGADEIRQQLHNEAIMESLRDTKSEIDSAIAETKRTIHDVTHPLSQPLSDPDTTQARDVGDETNASGGSTTGEQDSRAGSGP